MIYYDRRISGGLLRAWCASFGWLTAWLATPEAAGLLARVDWRRADGGRRLGGIQLYFGRTSPLELVATGVDRFEFRADARYRRRSPQLFTGRWSSRELASLQPALLAHLRASGDSLPDAFVEGEAVQHAGMMRRYGHQRRAGDPVVLVDSEVRVGFRGAGGRSGTALRTEHELSLRRAVALGSGSVPRKLDAIGVLDTGEVALVEVKTRGGDIRRALQQAAAHVFTFRALVAADADALNRSI